MTFEEETKDQKPRQHPDGIRWYEVQIIIQLSGDQDNKWDRNAFWEVVTKVNGKYKVLAEGREEDQYQAIYSAVDWLKNASKGLILKETGQTIKEAFSPGECMFSPDDSVIKLFECHVHKTREKHCYNCGANIDEEYISKEDDKDSEEHE